MFVEQAIFTSVRRAGRDGYQLAAISPGIGDLTARELSNWGPSHDSLRQEPSSAGSVNFYPLPDRQYCISYTTANGSEYSGRGGSQVYSQCFVVPPELLAKFQNHPERLLEALRAGGKVKTLANIPPRLDAVRLLGRASVVNRPLVEEVVGRWGIQRTTALLETVLDRKTAVFCGNADSHQVFSVLLDLLPPPMRAEISYSTGLKFSTQRPFRWIWMSNDPAEQRRVARLTGPALVCMDDELPSVSSERHPWVQWLREKLADGALCDVERTYAELTPTSKGSTDLTACSR